MPAQNRNNLLIISSKPVTVYIIRDNALSRGQTAAFQLNVHLSK